MAFIDHIDGANRDIYLHADTVGITFDPIEVYKEMRVLRLADESLRKFNLFLEAKGRDYKGQDSEGNDKYTEKYVVCLEGTRIVPYDVTQILTVTGTIITDDGQEGVACFDRSPLSPTTNVDINYVPQQVEVIVITTGGGAGPTAEEIAQAVADFDLTGYSLHSTVGGILVRSAYNGVVEVNLGSAYSGTEFPIGMKHMPVNNIPDALALLDRFHLSGLCINGNVPIPASTNLNGVNFCSGSTIDREISIPASATTNGTKFKNIILTGALNGRTEMKGCVIEDLVGIRGTCVDCTWSGNIGFDDSTGFTTNIIRGSSSGEQGTPIFDLVGAKVSIVDWVGKATLANKTGASYLGISSNGGNFDIEASCVAGFMIFTGEGVIKNNLAAGTIVISDDLLEKVNIANAVLDEISY